MIIQIQLTNKPHNMSDEELQSNVCIIAESLEDNQAHRDSAMLKLAEECSELSAELIQKVLHPLHEDGNTAITNEAGDMYARFLIFLELLSDEDRQRVRDRAEFKITKCVNRLHNV